MSQEGKVLCIGGGPAGLTAAYLLVQRGWPVVVLEANRRHLGGISRIVERNGFRCNIGGHRIVCLIVRDRDLFDDQLLYIHDPAV